MKRTFKQHMQSAIKKYPSRMTIFDMHQLAVNLAERWMQRTEMIVSEYPNSRFRPLTGSSAKNILRDVLHDMGFKKLPQDVKLDQIISLANLYRVKTLREHPEKYPNLSKK